MMSEQITLYEHLRGLVYSDAREVVEGDIIPSHVVNIIRETANVIPLLQVELHMTE